jgi:hypothetical protein
MAFMMALVIIIGAFFLRRSFTKSDTANNEE